MSYPPEGVTVRLRIAGHAFALDRSVVCREVAREEPADIRDHFVEIGERRYPVKQALAAATGLDPSDFTTQHARSAMRRLGLPVGRLSGSHGTVTRDPSQADGAAGARRRSRMSDPASALRPYRGRWVALQRNHVLTDGDSFADVLAWLRGNGLRADAVFLVPDDPERLLTGLVG